MSHCKVIAVCNQKGGVGNGKKAIMQRQAEGVLQNKENSLKNFA